MRKPIEAQKPVQLLVEGNDYRNFFEAFVEHLSIGPQVQIHNFGGITDLSGFLTNVSFKEAVQKIGIVRDAESSAQSAFQSVQTALKRAGLPVPDQVEILTHKNGLRVAVLIVPGHNQPGMLETLLCASITENETNDCIGDFISCVQSLGSDFKRPQKARARIYIATKPEAHLSVGVAAKKDTGT